MIETITIIKYAMLCAALIVYIFYASAFTEYVVRPRWEEYEFVGCIIFILGIVVPTTIVFYTLYFLARSV